MSTRSQLRFTDGDLLAQVYRHSDGYPDAVLPDLKAVKAVQDATGTNRGPDYTASNFIFLNKLRGMGFYTGNTIGDRPSLDADDLLDIVERANFSPIEKLAQPFFLMGYGVEDPENDIHGDEEYLYVVDVSGEEWTVKVSEHSGFPRWDDDTESAFDDATWAFEGTLDDALDHFAEE